MLQLITDMNATQRKRLLKLADFIVDQVPAKKFEMGLYGWSLALSVDECGTAGCAIGWATVLFRKLGVCRNVFGMPAYKNRHGYGVGVTLFGLSYEQSEQLFTGEKSGRTAKQVRRDILRLVAKLDKEAKLR